MTLRVKEEDLEYWCNDAGGIPTYKYNGEPFTGTMLTYQDEGWLSGEEEYLNRYQEGWVRVFYKNGQVEIEYKKHQNRMLPRTYKKYDEAGNLLEN